MKEIELSKKGKKNKGKYVALVDDCDYEEVNKYNWSINKKYNTVYRADHSSGKYKRIQFHRFIWELHNGTIPDGYVIDHIDNNPLNNQLSNLRLATRHQNSMNKSKQKNNTSGYIGVSKTTTKDNRHGTNWEKTYWLANVHANIGVKGKSYTKYFPFTEEGKIEAAKWYDKKARELFGEFANLNFPDDILSDKEFEELNKSLSSKYRGVFYSKSSYVKKDGSQKMSWGAFIQFDGKEERKYFPFTDEGEIQAAKWYDAKAKELFGDKANLNFPD
jgi:hypothetical protein